MFCSLYPFVHVCIAKLTLASVGHCWCELKRGKVLWADGWKTFDSLDFLWKNSLYLIIYIEVNLQAVAGH